MHADPTVVPVWLRGDLEEPVSRWLWLVKWLLLIPHYVVLAVLWIVVAVLTVVAFFAILITGRYPRGMFDLVVGVLRWSWRVQYYGYSALGTDRYPPFALASSDYAADLHVAYPERLSRGLVLVKWWLLAIPQYLVVGALVGGGVTVGDFGTDTTGSTAISLVGILILIVIASLVFRGRYPQGVFDLLLGIHRWLYRVLAYALLLTNQYPPFRLDQGGREPGDAKDVDQPPPA